MSLKDNSKHVAIQSMGTLDLKGGNRRQFLTGASASVLGGAMMTSSLAPAAWAKAMNTPVEGLQKLLKGSVVERGDAVYEPWRKSLVWQFQKFPRYPDMIVQAEDAGDVIAAVNHARENNLKITTRAGGHSFCGCFLRDDGILLDVSRIQHLEIDADAQEVVVGPGVIGRRLNEELGKVGLAAAVAHCGMVPISGFLLGGGLAWNGNAWGGMASSNIIEVDIITPDGVLRKANETENPELYWAIRGGGPGLFGVVTQFKLKCFPLPKSIRSHTYIYPFTELENVAAAMSEIGPKVSLDVQLIMVVAKAPPGMEDACDAAGCDQVCILQSVAFVESEEEAVSAMTLMAEHPVNKTAIAAIENEEQSFEKLYYANEVPFPQRRYAVDNIYTSDLQSVVPILARNMPLAPSRDTAPVILHKGSPDLPDAACSTRGDFYVSCYAQWSDPEQDVPIKTWLTDMYEEMQPHSTGNYINELNQEQRIHRIESCYSPEAWAKLSALRAKWDPQGVFQNFYGLDDRNQPKQGG